MARVLPSPFEMMASLAAVGALSPDGQPNQPGDINPNQDDGWATTNSLLGAGGIKVVGVPKAATTKAKLNANPSIMPTTVSTSPIQSTRGNVGFDPDLGLDTFRVYDKFQGPNGQTATDETLMGQNPHQNVQVNSAAPLFFEPPAYSMGGYAKNYMGRNDGMGQLVNGTPPIVKDETDYKPFKIGQLRSHQFATPAAQNTATLNITPNFGPTPGAGSTGTGAGGPKGNTYDFSAPTNPYNEITNPPPINSRSYFEAAKNVGLTPTHGVNYADSTLTGDPAQVRNQAQVDSAIHTDQASKDYYSSHIKPVADELDLFLKQVVLPASGMHPFPAGAYGNLWNKHIRPNAGGNVIEWMRQVYKNPHGPDAQDGYDALEKIKTDITNMGPQVQIQGMGGTRTITAAEAQDIVNGITKLQQAIFNR